MTTSEFASVLVAEISDRVSEAVRDTFEFCDSRGEALTREQRFAAGSIALRVVLGLDESLTSMTETFLAIRKVAGAMEFPDSVEAWLRSQPTERTH